MSRQQNECSLGADGGLIQCVLVDKMTSGQAKYSVHANEQSQMAMRWRPIILRFFFSPMASLGALSKELDQNASVHSAEKKYRK